MRGAAFLAGLVVLASGACGPGGPPAPGQEDGLTDPTNASTETLAGMLQEVTAWQGELPCADCAGIVTTLVLAPDGTFRLSEAYLGLPPERRAEGDTLVGDRGHWTLTQAPGRIRLLGSHDEPRNFRPTSRGTLRLLDRAGQEIQSELPYELERLPRVPDLEAPMTVLGAFTYMADAPGVVLCPSGLRFPVAMEGGYLELERTYLEELAGRGDPAGTPMRVHLTGSVQDRPAMEGEGTEAAFVVRTFETAGAASECAALRMAEALARSEWRLVRLDGAPLPALPDPAVTPSVTWDPEESQVTGYGGCNQFGGRAFLRGSVLVSGELVMTRRFCEGVMELEDRFLAVLSAGGHLQWVDGELALYHGPLEVARFEAHGG